ncbi:hypothetical protein I307_05930 [Cryptococcus deuterogattii 99/473]|uniref:Uncharacterized protein n=1 Tax=Cryptococcus deuterogattii Ram5 TaxID=1296110 RepID=A0A0D0V5K0_9TREE|nr:hypothetical protein I313_03562 [Cryptococcus deuterogattii Ram5]KIR71954.1 hypothetical protein I310_04004 [Cryptococcus deuterogattii CA1014]KIR99783.1 hypothetical protein L804_02417 [Cryptococcus deuterogattii 2001/935-1]KIY54744.1 hypothetical protein I307_05930 [Cryptococcus deuterogattii 99/473]
MPPAEPPLPPAASTLSLPDSSLAAAAAANVTFATPLREGAILCRIFQLEVGSPPNNLPASPAAPSPAPSAQGKAKDKATSDKLVLVGDDETARKN